MDKRLSSYHAVQEHSTRIPDRLDDLTIRIGGSIVEGEHRERCQDRIRPLMGRRAG
jgi:hypothetical protein